MKHALERPQATTVAAQCISAPISSKIAATNKTSQVNNVPTNRPGDVPELVDKPIA